jgi:hypothetical protein
VFDLLIYLLQNRDRIVCYGSKAAARVAHCRIRFPPNSGREAARSACPLRAKSGYLDQLKY